MLLVLFCGLWLHFESLQIAVQPLSLVDSSARVHHHPERPYHLAAPVHKWNCYRRWTTYRYPQPRITHQAIVCHKRCLFVYKEHHQTLNVQFLNEAFHVCNAKHLISFLLGVQELNSNSQMVTSCSMSVVTEGMLAKMVSQKTGLTDLHKHLVRW